MANWAVVASKIKLFPHPNADALEIGKVGPFQVVVAKSNGYKDGDVIVFAPERSILPDDLKGHYVNSETGISYLKGSEHNRVASVRLRGEISEGVTIPRDYVTEKLGWEDIALDEDLSSLLGITKYEPPIPIHLAGEIEAANVNIPWRQHDVERAAIYVDEFTPGESVYAFEKVHGSQMVIVRTADGKRMITSKGFAKYQNVIKESETNTYWQAAANTAIFEKLAVLYPNQDAQVFGEVVPVQKGYNYGFEKPHVLLFRVIVDGQEVPFPEVPNILKDLWVPKIFEGPFNLEELTKLAKGMETVSGKNKHIREGIVVSPVVPRRAREGFALYVKLINPKYTGDEEAFS